MRVARTIAELDLDRTKRIALVPTMGAFHEGHLSLMRAARPEADIVVVSLFVNPTQFGEGEDYASYPRDEDRDFALASEAGVDVIFAPTAEEMYARNQTRIHVAGVSERWEGEYRPGHFDGVATVVAKLFNIVRPDFAVFGLKDYQQCAVIRQMVADLNYSIVLRFEETVREADGLAMSSRNVYLSPEERGKAPQLHRELTRLASQLRATMKDKNSIDACLQTSQATLDRVGFRVQYLAWVHAETLVPLGSSGEVGRVIGAAYLGKTRLIDNVSA